MEKRCVLRQQLEKYLVPLPDRKILHGGVVVVQDADGARMALYTDGTVCIEAGRFEDLAPAQGGCVWARQNGQWGLLEVK